MMKHLLATFAFLVSAGLVASQASAMDARPELVPDDCSKCHDAAPAAIEAKGMAHKTDVGCTDCHVGHPPRDADIIPKCDMCHSDTPHFELPNCAGCHSNPHTPLEIAFSDDVTDPCLTCHTEQMDQMKVTPTLHKEQPCSSCHSTHLEIPNCTRCHEPHSADMVQQDCLTCHKAHVPVPVAYPDTIPNVQCGSCHDTALDLLMASKAKHKDVTCVDCHVAEHKMIPMCQDCHGVPHPQAIMVKFPTCGDCHGIAHDLSK